MSNIQLRIAVIALLLTGVSMQVWAEEEQEGPWSGKIAIGYLAVSGNAENTSFTGKAELNWDGERWHHGLSGKVLGNSVDKETTAEAYQATYETKFDLVERTYLFGLLDYNKNRFSSYDQQIFEVAGIGQRLIKTDRHELNAELGAGASQQRLVEEPVPGTIIKTDINEATFRISGDYTWNISENSTFSQKLSATSGSSNTYTESITELSAGIIGELSTVLGYTVRHNSDVADGRDKSDTFASISLEYLF
jgi:putative salt-induced outer membrane protein